MRKILLALLLCASPAGAQSIDTAAIKAHTRFLADDLLLGRGTGTQGERIAAAYIESQLIRLGVEPIGDSFRLPVPLRSAFILPSTTLTLTMSGQTQTYATGRDFVLNTGGEKAFRDFRGALVIAGAPANALQFLRGAADLRGRVVVFDGPLGSDATALVPFMIERGVTGVILRTSQQQFALYVRSRGDRRFFAAADVRDPIWQPDLPVIIAGPALSAALAENAIVAATIRTSIDTVAAANVAGIIEGTDTARRNDLLVYTAHYDHLGVSVPDANGDSIYNGFSDNAAGTAMLLALADAFRRDPPPYSVAFLFFTGEERGLLGSSYMAAYPPFPLNRVSALINLDAGAPPAPPVSWRVAGGVEAASLGSLAVEVARQAGWQTVTSAASPNSDYWPFLARGVPAVFIVPGNEWEATTTAQRDALRARWDHYHEAGDHWAADFPFGGLARYAAYALRLGRAAAAK